VVAFEAAGGGDDDALRLDPLAVIGAHDDALKDARVLRRREDVGQPGEEFRFGQVAGYGSGSLAWRFGAGQRSGLDSTVERKPYF
jgi:hypothetical protein